MRPAFALPFILVSLAACDQNAGDHLRAAGDNAKAAVAQVGAAVTGQTPAIKDAVRRDRDDIRQAGYEDSRDLRDAEDHAREEIAAREAAAQAQADQRAQDDLRDARTRAWNDNRDENRSSDDVHTPTDTTRLPPH
jgi:hypothetical protein